MSDDEKRDDPTNEDAGAWLRVTCSGLIDRAERQQREAEEHERACTARPCARCQRAVCRCGAPIDGGLEVCATCDLQDTYDARTRPTIDSIGKRFAPLFHAKVEELVGRVTASRALLQASLERPPSDAVLFIGPTGAGKTTLMSAMLGAWVRSDPRGRMGALFVSAGRFARERARYRLGGGEAPEVERAISAPLVALDDLGNETSDRDGCINDLIWARWDAAAPLWITTGLVVDPNATEDQIAELLGRKYDGGFARRVVEESKIVRLGRRPGS